MKTKNLENTLNIVKENFLRYFTFKGTIDDWQFFAAVFLAEFICLFLGYFPIPHLDLVNYFIYGYIMLIAYQKRCRDVGLKGTPIIIFITLYFFYTAILNPPGIDKYGILGTISTISDWLYALLTIFMMLRRSSPNKNAELTSPLLKHPYLYVLACTGICLWGISVVSEHQDEIIQAVT